MRYLPPPRLIAPPLPNAPVSHPGVLHAIQQALSAGLAAPYHAGQWFMDTEGRMNRFYALQEALNPIAGKRSSQWAWDILNPHGPFQRDRARHFIHPVGR